MQGDKELDETETLEQQGVQAGSDLLAVPANAWRVTVTIASGHRFPVVLEPNTTVAHLKCVLEKLTVLPISSQRMIYVKAALDADVFPSAVDGLQAFIKLGKAKVGL